MQIQIPFCPSNLLLHSAQNNAWLVFQVRPNTITKDIPCVQVQVLTMKQIIVTRLHFIFLLKQKFLLLLPRQYTCLNPPLYNMKMNLFCCLSNILNVVGLTTLYKKNITSNRKEKSYDLFIMLGSDFFFFLLFFSHVIKRKITLLSK